MTTTTPETTDDSVSSTNPPTASTTSPTSTSTTDGEDSSDSGTSGSGGVGCQMDAGRDWEYSRTDRMPALGEILGLPTEMVPHRGTTQIVADPEPAHGTVGFIMDPDAGGTSVECDIWAQDCPAGQKCMPWANDGGGSWNATRCSPIDADPDQVGDPCEVEGGGVSGVDTCDIRQMCWDVDPGTNMGTCVAMCTGSEADPMCEADGTICSISNDGVLILCLPLCNPLADDCGDGEGCYPTGDAFQCAPDASGDSGAPGDPCENINVCDPGTMCASVASVPGCAASGCCTAFCEIGDDTPCLPGQVCVPYYDGPAPDPCLEGVGVCVAE